MKPRLDLGEMTREEVRRIASESVVILPTASIEQHGPHLPIQTDTLICEAVCRRAAGLASAQVSVTIAPTICYGNSHHHHPYPGVLSLTSTTFTRLVYEVGEALVRSGFLRIIIVNGHGGNDEIVRVVARDLANAHPVAIGATSYWQLAQEALTAEAESIGPIPGHAGGFETAAILALRPDLVDGLPPYAGGPTSRVFAPSPLPIDVHWGGRRIGDGPGYTEDAACASAERGERFLELISEALARCIVEFAEAK